MIAFLSSCKEPQKKITIGFSQCIEAHDWRKEMDENMLTEIQLANDKNIEYIIKNARGNTNRQIKQVKELINQKVDILIISPREAAPLTPIVTEAYKKGIPVIVVDRNVVGENFTSFIGGDNIEVGKIASKLLTDKLLQKKADKSVILEITGLKSSTPAQKRSRGFHKNFRKLNKDSIITINSDWTYKTTQRKLDSFFEITSVDIKGIFSHNDQMAAAARNVSEKYSQNPVIIGVDGLNTRTGGLQLVRNYKIDGTVFYPTGGEEAIQTALAIIDKKKVNKYNYLKTFPIDSRNAQGLKFESDRLKAQKKKLIAQLQNFEKQSALLNKKNTIIFYFALLLGLLAASIAFLVISVRRRKKAEKLLKAQVNIINNQNEKITKQRDKLVRSIIKTEELSEIQTNFFTNISHEFRTYLSLLKIDIDTLSSENEKNVTLKQLKVNIQKLIYLLNNLLQFKNVQEYNYKTELVFGDFSKFLKQTLDIFITAAETKKLDFEINTKKINCDFDAKIIASVVSNIVSNSIKYTNEGKINVSLKEKNNWVVISITDTGIGIPGDELSQIFERHHRASNAAVSDVSSGIGLHYCKQLMTIHNGTIEITSQENIGTTVIISFPKFQLDHPKNDVLKNLPSNRKSVLIVEDNSELRKRIVSILNDDYFTLEAENGKIGLEKAHKNRPDMVVSDILMPEMDGIQLCKEIKTNPSTINTPVILLSAVDQDNSVVKSFDFGADDYMVKPFSREILLSRIKNLFEKKHQKQQTTSAILNSEEITTTSEEAIFLDKIKEITYANLTNENFSIDDLASQLFMSRSKFYRTLKEITGDAPVYYLQKLKLAYASSLLQNTSYSISEIAYKSGFSDVKYFSKCFSKMYKNSPSEFRKL